ncbi:MAG: hypothetical protein SF053_02090 [Bacteroidia bacterium]|nr:hypothetical protein [Bacteroidia bacterium]
MQTWQDYLTYEPILLRIESLYTRLLQLEEAWLGRDTAATELLSETRILLQEAIRTEAARIPGKLYYWMYPFYSGDFLRLVAALGCAGAMERQEDTADSRAAFYSFFKTVPLQTRLKLGQRLNHPELTARAQQIEDKLRERRDTIKQTLDAMYAN